MIAAVILAAGEGRRMGGPKALLILDGESLLQRTVRVAMAAGCDPVIAVVGDWDPGPLDAAVSVVHNRKASEGMASSIRAGIAALAPGIESALILTVDQPTVDATLLRKLLALAIEAPNAPVACSYGNSLGIPAVLPQRLFADLMALKGDRGAKAVLLRERTTALPFPEGEADLDSPEDLERIRR